MGTEKPKLTDRVLQAIAAALRMGGYPEYDPAAPWRRAARQLEEILEQWKRRALEAEEHWRILYRENTRLILEREKALARERERCAQVVEARIGGIVGGRYLQDAIDAVRNLK